MSGPSTHRVSRHQLAANSCHVPNVSWSHLVMPRTAVPRSGYPCHARSVNPLGPCEKPHHHDRNANCVERHTALPGFHNCKYARPQHHEGKCPDATRVIGFLFSRFHQSSANLEGSEHPRISPTILCKSRGSCSALAAWFNESPVTIPVRQTGSDPGQRHVVTAPLALDAHSQLRVSRTLSTVCRLVSAYEPHYKLVPPQS